MAKKFNVLKVSVVIAALLTATNTFAADVPPIETNGPFCFGTAFCRPVGSQPGYVTRSDLPANAGPEALPAFNCYVQNGAGSFQAVGVLGDKDNDSREECNANGNTWVRHCFFGGFNLYPAKPGLIPESPNQGQLKPFVPRNPRWR